MSPPDGKRTLDPSPEPKDNFGPGNTFQNRNVSSPAPVTILCPSGLIAKYRTLKESEISHTYIHRKKHL
jgi:hypothetical protein